MSTHPLQERKLFLNEVFADLYPTIQESRRVVVRAGLRPAFVQFDAASIINWFNILEDAERHGRVDELVEAALNDFPDHPLLRSARRQEPPPAAGPDIRTDVQWSAPKPAEALEKIIGSRSTLLPISHLEIGLLRSRSVARVVRADRSSGSGFVVKGDLLLTNHHVLPNADEAARSIVEFNYQLTTEGLPTVVDLFRLNPERRFATNKEDDWTLVAFEREPVNWGSLAVGPSVLQVGDFVSIIQHPGGGYKQIGMFHNTVAYVGEGRVQYLTDTLPGSSGSPVFNDRWEVVALHHSGGMLREPGTKSWSYRNEGIHINRVIDGAAVAGISLADP